MKCLCVARTLLSKLIQDLLRKKSVRTDFIDESAHDHLRLPLSMGPLLYQVNPSGTGLSCAIEQTSACQGSTTQTQYIHTTNHKDSSWARNSHNIFLY